MKKFILLPIGHEDHSPEVMAKWGAWFGSISKHIVDSGNPFMPGKEVSKAGIKDMPYGDNCNNGYTIINAENMDEALEIASSCPYSTAIRVYEAIAI